MVKPKRIIHSGNATIVFWNDDTKTVVRCAEDDTQDNYNAFCAAYCKKVFGNNSHLKRIIKDAENAKSEKVDKHKDFYDSLSIPAKIFNERIKQAVDNRLFKPVYQPVLKRFPMPGCTNCKSVDNCVDCYSSNAIHCNNYDDPYGFL